MTTAKERAERVLCWLIPYNTATNMLKFIEREIREAQREAAERMRERCAERADKPTGLKPCAGCSSTAADIRALPVGEKEGA